jgi:hypothetical protein
VLASLIAVFMTLCTGVSVFLWLLLLAKICMVLGISNIYSWIAALVLAMLLTVPTTMLIQHVLVFISELSEKKK